MLHGNLITTLFSIKNPSVNSSHVENYVIDVKKDYKIQMYGCNSNRYNYIYYEVSGYVVY